MNSEMEKGLQTIVNKIYYEHGVVLEDGNYQKIDVFLFNKDIVKKFLKKSKFKRLGSILDFPNVLPQPERLTGHMLKKGLNNLTEIYISEKYNAVCTVEESYHATDVEILVDRDNLKKFSKKITAMIKEDDSNLGNPFLNIDFNCTGNEYIEVTSPVRGGGNGEEENRTAFKREISNEKLVFDEKSTIYEVMQDIHTFFQDKTKGLYDSMEIPYKRGVILFGDPGNGKSAMIRELIRKIPEITKVVISTNVNSYEITNILSTLVRALNGKKTMIVIEDIDSLITDDNRSQFLNILDGVEVNSGVYFIGTTNYPEKIDPAFMNRAGRFDRTFKIENPSEATRRYFFEGRKLGKLLGEFKVFDDEKKSDSNEGIVDLFVKFSNGFPMASLKELLRSTQYELASSEDDITVESALQKVSDMLKSTRTEHQESHDSNQSSDRHGRKRLGGRNSRRASTSILDQMID